MARKSERRFRDTHTRLAAPSFGTHPPTFSKPPPISAFLEDGELADTSAEPPTVATARCKCCGEHAVKVVVMQFESCASCEYEYVGKVR